MSFTESVTFQTGQTYKTGRDYHGIITPWHCKIHANEKSLINRKPVDIPFNDIHPKANHQSYNNGFRQNPELPNRRFYPS